MTFWLAVQQRHYFETPYIKTGLVISVKVRNAREQM